MQLTAPQRKMLGRIKAMPVSCGWSCDDQRITKGLAKRGLIERREGQWSNTVSWWVTAAGIAALEVAYLEVSR